MIQTMFCSTASSRMADDVARIVRPLETADGGGSGKMRSAGPDPPYASLVDARSHSVRAIATMQTPLLVTTVDAEEAFDWSLPFSRDSHDVSSMRDQYLAHRIFERYGVIPTYFVTYPVVEEEAGWGFLREQLAAGKCEIGAQLHPWVTPPFEESVDLYHSYPGNLPEALEYEKLKRLTESISDRFGARPLFYRAGRYGVGPCTARLLQALGYLVDSSVVPEHNYAPDGGPSFLGYPVSPYWADSGRTLLELPITSAYVGFLTGWSSGPARLLAGTHSRLLRSIAARSRMVERIRLTPEGTTIDDAKRLVHALLARGIGVFTLSYHTPSLVPGCTPYVRSLADRNHLLGWLDQFYAYFIHEAGGRPATAMEIYRLAEKGTSG